MGGRGSCAGSGRRRRGLSRTGWRCWSSISGRGAMIRAFVFGAMLALQPVAGFAQELPVREGTCVRTRIAALEHRLASGPRGPFVADSGSAVRYANVAYQVSYDELPQIR